MIYFHLCSTCIALVGFHLTSDFLICAQLLVVQQNINLKLSVFTCYPRVLYITSLLRRREAFRAIADNILVLVCGSFYNAVGSIE
jgi:hypothetical protein